MHHPWIISVESRKWLRRKKSGEIILCVTQKAQNISMSPYPTVEGDINIHTADSQDEPSDETSNINENRIM